MNKILIIEDDQVVANIYRNKFSLEGFQVEVANDGHLGLELIHNFRPDAVIVDLMLPRVTGLELVRKVRAEPAFEHLPLIVFSNTYLTGMIQDAWKAGATKCLCKSNCTPKQVIEIVRGELAGNGISLPAIKTAGSNPAPKSAPAAGAASPGMDDAKFHADLRKSFIEGWPGALSSLRAVLQALIKADSDQNRLKQVQELYRRIHVMTGTAGIIGLQRIAQMADALEALLKELHEKPKNITASTLRTVASAVDFLGVLFDRGTAPEHQEFPQTNILVVDDEAISRRAITFALEKANLKSVNVEDPAVAFTLLSENPYDLIFLDVDMPGMNGFELCTKLRALPAHKKTPVVFVTSLNGFESRANSTISGGTDFIAKPFLFIELAVKALVYVLRGQAGKPEKASL